MTTISASIVADSISEQNIRPLTWLLRYPRWIHAEFMTHRVFSRNSASSRAIPVEKLIQSCLDDPAVPLFWGANQKGMQADVECDETIWYAADQFADREQAWRRAMNDAIKHARAFDKAGYHKQIVNRLIEPFMHITVVATATDTSNFFALRCHKAAEPHMRLLAERMRDAMKASTPKLLKPGQWHLPFVTDEENPWLRSWCAEQEKTDAIKLSVARCASVSYKTVEGFDMTMDRALALHDKLVGSAPLHASPCEHQATPDGKDSYNDGKFHWEHPEEHGNFKGWRQYRKMLPGEC